MLFDLNIDELNNTIINKNSNGKTMTTDTEYWQLRNYIINRFCRNTDFWTKFKNIKRNNRTEIEKNIENAIYDRVTNEVRTKLKVCVLITGRKATIYFIQLSNNIYSKDKLLFDFKITV